MDLINSFNQSLNNIEYMIPQNTVCINQDFYNANINMLNNNSLIFQSINKIYIFILFFCLILLIYYLISFYNKNKLEIIFNNFIENLFIILFYPIILLNLVLKFAIEKNNLKFTIILIIIELIITPYIYLKVYSNCDYIIQKIIKKGDYDR